MTFKKTLAGITLAAGVMVAPIAKAETKPADTQAKTQEVAQGEKIAMPAWIPTTPEGEFDKEKAKKQAEILWQNNGQIIQQYADDVKTGVPEEIAFAKFAHKLAKGDKKQEEQIFSLYDAVKGIYQECNGDMNQVAAKMKVCTILLIGLCLALGLSIKRTKNDPNSSFKLFFKTFAKYLNTAFALTMGISKAFPTSTEEPVDTFVRFQEETFKKYQTESYAMTDMATTKKIIQMEQTAKGMEK